MPVYNFKSMAPVPTSSELIDIVLVRTQRRTPTIIHPGYKITRIRSFYMRKIKFTQQTIHERLTTILTDFPRLTDIHPFYADLCNTLYDKDHYKLALGQLNTARTLTTQISRDLIRMVKYGDSAYRCKCLKRAALGRMCTLLRRLNSSLVYLKEVRLHMSRLPSLDPHARTVLLCGAPNVGKSSYMNKVTRANVDVQPYAFTTKSLYVGHMDYRYLRWQVIDTPGLLDRPLEERNVIEMQAVTALAHLQCAVLFVIDISERCGSSIEHQCKLFRSIRPLFVNKQLIVVANKVDIQPYDTLPEDSKELIQSMIQECSNNNVAFATMSNESEEGISRIKAMACDRLLATRVEGRVHCAHGVDNILSRLQVFHPKEEDGMVRDVYIPDSVILATKEGRYRRKSDGDQDDSDVEDPEDRVGYAPTKKDLKRNEEKRLENSPTQNNHSTTTITHRQKTARELMWENGGPGVWAPDYRETYDLHDPNWRFDAIPQIIDGKNIADYVDPDISTKLESLEKEEEQMELEAQAAHMGYKDNEPDLSFETNVTVQAIRDQQNVSKIVSRAKRSHNKPVVPRTVRGRAKDVNDQGVLDAKEIRKTMGMYGVNADAMITRGLNINRKKNQNKRGRSATHRDTRSTTRDDESNVLFETKRHKMNENDQNTSNAQSRNLTTRGSHSRTISTVREPSQMGLRNEAAMRVTTKLDREGKRSWALGGKSGEGDRRESAHLIKWMNSGKKRLGTHNKR